MATDLARTTTVHPATGEVLSLDQPTPLLAEALEQVREFEGQLRAFKRDVSDAILERMDNLNSYTLRDGDFEVAGDGPGRVTYDPEAVAGVLSRLVAEGHITQEAADSVCEPVVTHKLDRRKLNLLLKRGGEIKEAIEAVSEPVPPERRRVSVKRRVQ